MPTITSLFGQEESQIKKTCILAPIVTKGLLEGFGIEGLARGKPYASGNSTDLTLIYTQIGAPFVGDAVLHLKDTPCENIILLGSCGGVQSFPGICLGSLVIPQAAYNFESFSALLTASALEATKSGPDETLFHAFTAGCGDLEIHPVNCATFGSLYLEEKYHSDLITMDIDVLDMECSALFNAAKQVGIKAIAVFYVTDILFEQHVLRQVSSEEHKVIADALQKAQRSICAFVRKIQ